MTSYYDILEVNKNASESEIKKAPPKLAGLYIIISNIVQR